MAKTKDQSFKMRIIPVYTHDYLNVLACGACSLRSCMNTQACVLIYGVILLIFIISLDIVRQ